MGFFVGGAQWIVVCVDVRRFVGCGYELVV